VTYQPGAEPPARPSYPSTVRHGGSGSTGPAGGPSLPSPANAPRPGATEPRAGFTSRGRIRTTRMGALWSGLIVAALLLIALLIFITQNSKQVTIHFLGFDGQISLAVALLLAAVGGLLLIAIPGTARIVQLRRALKRNAAAADAKRLGSAE
jgi:uncharacterized integral membrane protein